MSEFIYSLVSAHRKGKLLRLQPLEEISGEHGHGVDGHTVYALGTSIGNASVLEGHVVNEEGNHYHVFIGQERQLPSKLSSTTIHFENGEIRIKCAGDIDFIDLTGLYVSTWTKKNVEKVLGELVNLLGVEKFSAAVRVSRDNEQVVTVAPYQVKQKGFFRTTRAVVMKLKRIPQNMEHKLYRELLSLILELSSLIHEGAPEVQFSDWEKKARRLLEDVKQIKKPEDSI